MALEQKLKSLAVLFSSQSLHHSYIFDKFLEGFVFFAINIDQNEKKQPLICVPGKTLVNASIRPCSKSN